MKLSEFDDSMGQCRNYQNDMATDGMDLKS